MGIATRTGLVLLFLFNAGYAQETPDEGTPQSAIPIRSWNDFQRTQEEIVARQGRILGRLDEIRDNVRQFNLNFLSWQETNNEIIQLIGDNRGCDIFKYKYRPEVEWAVIGLAVVGILALYNIFIQKPLQKLQKKPEKTEKDGV